MSHTRWIRLATVISEKKPQKLDQSSRSSQNNFNTKYRPKGTLKLGWRVVPWGSDDASKIKFDVKADFSGKSDETKLEKVQHGDTTGAKNSIKLYIANPRKAKDRFSVECYAVIDSDTVFPFERWMEDFADAITSKSLREICIPGTHDSGTYSISKHSKAGNDKDGGAPNDPSQYLEWCQAQGYSIDQQLLSGIRYLDLRLDRAGGDDEMYITHSWRGERVDAVLKAVAAFLDDHPREIVILDFQHLYHLRDADYRTLADKLKSFFGPKMAPPAAFDTSIGEMWRRGYQVVALIGSKKGKPGAAFF